MSSSTTKVLLIAAASAVAVYLLVRKTPASAPAAAQATPYSGKSGTLSWLSNTVSQLIGATAYDPRSAVADRSTPIFNPSIVSNPVSPATSVLPYSYKQATVDIPSLLGTDDLFTPGSGSSGNYIEDDVGEPLGGYYA